MILCVAVDDNMGMMFNRRRQSQDKNLRKYLIALVKESFGSILIRKDNLILRCLL